MTCPISCLSEKWDWQVTHPKDKSTCPGQWTALFSSAAFYWRLNCSNKKLSYAVHCTIILHECLHPGQSSKIIKFNWNNSDWPDNIKNWDTECHACWRFLTFLFRVCWLWRGYSQWSVLTSTGETVAFVMLNFHKMWLLALWRVHGQVSLIANFIPWHNIGAYQNIGKLWLHQMGLHRTFPLCVVRNYLALIVLATFYGKV